MEKFIIATTNLGKVVEIKKLLQGFPIEICSLADFPEIGDIEENGNSFLENAHIKAEAIYKMTGCMCLADDSGLEVDYLDGAPGIYSARYAGEEKNDSANNAKLLQAMEGVADDDRGAQFHCAIVAINANGKIFEAEGIVRGTIGYECIGENGFGYDCLFYPEGKDYTMAEMALEEKNKISHRALALEKLVEILKKDFFIA